MVTRDGSDVMFACQEGQTVNFNDGGSVPVKPRVTVTSAVYGALTGGESTQAQAFNVTGIVQGLLDKSNEPVVCNNDSFGGDPSPGNSKHFAAVVTRDGANRYFACKEGQAIDFSVGGGT